MLNLSGARHVGGARVADVGVVRPDNAAAVGTVMVEQARHRALEVLGARVPGSGTGLRHPAQVALAVLDDFGVLVRFEQDAALFGVGGPIAGRQLCGDARDLRLRRMPGSVDVAGVGEVVTLKNPQGLVATLDFLGGGFRQMGPGERQHGIQGVPQAVDIDAVDVHPVFRRSFPIQFPKPFPQGRHFRVGPHPQRPALDLQQGFAGRGGRVRVMADVAVERDQRRPVAFHGDEGEAPFLDQAARQSVAPGVKLPGAVGRFAEQHPPSVADGFEQGSQVVGLSQGLGQGAQSVLWFRGLRTWKPDAYRSDEEREQGD